MPERDQPDHGRPRRDQPGQDTAGNDGAASLPLSGPVPADGTAPQGRTAPQDGTAPQGLSWSWELDFETLVAALNEPAPWNRPPRRPSVGGMAASAAAPGGAASGTSAPVSAAPGASSSGTSAPEGAASEGAASEGAASEGAASEGAAADGAARDGAAGEGAAVLAGDGAAAGAGGLVDQDAVLDALLAAEVREVPLTVAAGRVAECLPAGPGLAGWLASADVGELEDGALAGVAASWRRVASWAQAGELAVVAQLASRSAARDPKICVGSDGRPARVPDGAAAEVSLGLVMSRCAADWWLDLAVTLTWRLAATGAALAAGMIDLPRARLIAEATSLLADADARTVEGQVLPRAGELTSAGLRAALRRAVIAADPDGAERRRQQAEARAKLCLYPGEDGTATLAGYQLPGISAAAAMARISALARALKASGAGGGIALLRAQVFLGLLCGTLPLIPPADGAPPDDPPPPGPDDGTPPPSTPPPGSGPPPGTPPPGGAPPGDGPGPRTRPAPREQARKQAREQAAPRQRNPGQRSPGRGPACRGPAACRGPRLPGTRRLAGTGLVRMCRRPRGRRRTSRPTTPNPARARAMTPVTTGPGTGAPDRARPRTGRRCPAASPPRPAPGASTTRPAPAPAPSPGGRRPGCWTWPCPGPPWPA